MDLWNIDMCDTTRNKRPAVTGIHSLIKGFN